VFVEYIVKISNDFTAYSTVSKLIGLASRLKSQHKKSNCHIIMQVIRKHCSEFNYIERANV